MRQRALWQSGLLLSFVVTACSGDPATSPPPASGGGAVTLVVSAGDAQQAAPGAAVASAPVVTARNSAGQPAAGVAITFAIDSGGGVIAASQATTGADGTASPGAWTMGAAEGPNVLSVSASGATTIRIRATAIIPTVKLVTDVSVPRTGGVVTVAVPGNPFNGLTLTVPDTAFAAPAVISIATKSIKVPTLPAGYAQVGPALVITNSQGTATRPMVMSIPITVQSPDTALATFFVDPATGTFELLPITARTATTLTVFSRHFSASKMIKLSTARISPRIVGASASVRDSSGTFAPAVVIVVSVPTATLNAATTTGFQPGRDDWEFANYGSILETRGICAGMSISAMYYFYALRGSGTLNGRYNTVAAGLYRDYTNNVGIRLASVVQVDANQDAVRRWSDFVAGFAMQTGVPTPTLFYQSLVMAMQVTHLPQLLTLSGANFGHAVVAFGSANGSISFADPNEPGNSRTMTFANNAFVPFPFQSRGGAPDDVVNRVETIGASAMIDASALAADWAQVPDQSIGALRFRPALMQRYNSFDAAFVTVDTTRVVQFTSVKDFSVRTKCSSFSCGLYYLPDSLLNTKILSEAGALLSDGGSSNASVTLTRGTQKLGILEVALADVTRDRFWNRFRWITVNYQPVALAPVSPQLVPDSTLALTVTTGELASQIAKYTWEFNDGAASATTTAPAVNHKYSALGAFKARVTMADSANKVIARDSTTVTVAFADKAYSVWQLDTIAISPGTPGTPAANSLAGQKALLEYNRQLTYWNSRVALPAVDRPTLWFFGTSARINNAAAAYGTGLYQSDSLPGSAAGRDPTLVQMGITAALAGSSADDPAFNASWLVTGTPPNGGMLTARSAPPFSFECIGVFRSAIYSTFVTFAMNNTRGNGTMTYTFRDLIPSCTAPNTEISRWTLVVTFKAKRVQ